MCVFTSLNVEDMAHQNSNYPDTPNNSLNPVDLV